jgi:hypothetical protein
MPVLEVIKGVSLDTRSGWRARLAEIPYVVHRQLRSWTGLIRRFQRLAFVTNGIALRMLESSSGSDGPGSFDEVTVRISLLPYRSGLQAELINLLLSSISSSTRYTSDQSIVGGPSQRYRCCPDRPASSADFLLIVLKSLMQERKDLKCA